MIRITTALLAALCLLAACGNEPEAPASSTAAASSGAYKEAYRPQIHFTPQTSWMNDPNGMVFHNGTYHLFYQYYPDSTVWGPMHWGHATSKDLVRWEHQPVALYPDTLGYIFSGSAVVDKDNTSGFGKDGQTPLVAIFTHHDTVGEKAGRNTFQNQSLAYSLDEGKTWTKYAGNPVLNNPGIVDFRDPKVMWYEPQKKWVMTLAAKDRIAFYSSPNLKEWKKESEFGQKLGAHGGVWECPDLFTLEDKGRKVWVLIVNINPGGPNGGSATQYFLGDFDGRAFTPRGTATKWLDYGPDEYAGITWANTGERKIFLGWMSNWLYAQVVPTAPWRSAMTVPRELKLVRAGNDLHIASEPVKELEGLAAEAVRVENINAASGYDLSGKTGKAGGPFRLEVEADRAADLSVVLSNARGEELVMGYDKGKNSYYIDRSKSGKVDFHKEFGARHFAPRFSSEENMKLTVIGDVSSVELFADGGLSVMTEIFFPSEPYSKLSLRSAEGTTIKTVSYTPLKGIW